MPIESATFLTQLVPANPLTTDGVAQGDDHLRLLKQVLQNTFPSVAGAVSATDVELSLLSGFTGTTAKLNVLSGFTGTTANLNVLSGTTATTADLNGISGKATGLATLSNAELTSYGAINAGNLTQLASAGAVVPSGIIALWFGSSASIPAGWVVCNGANGTPNMQNQVPLGITAGTPTVSFANLTLDAVGSGVTTFFFLMKT